MSVLRLNAYYCDACKGYVVTEDVDEGVTPMFLACRVLGEPTAPSNTCKGRSVSMMYPEQPWPSHAPEPIPTWEWYAPDADEHLTLDEASLEHVVKGGLLLRPKGGSRKAPPPPPRRVRRARKKAKR